MIKKGKTKKKNVLGNFQVIKRIKVQSLISNTTGKQACRKAGNEKKIGLHWIFFFKETDCVYCMTIPVFAPSCLILRDG